MPTILFIDNDEEFIDLRVPWLESSGYKVMKAMGIKQVREILAKELEFDLAIVDVRMSSQANADDESGLYLARDIAMLGKPTLVLTGHPNYEFVRRAQVWFPDGTLAHMNFMEKDESREMFLSVVKGTLGRNVFIVHGHTDEALSKIELFIRQIDLVPIVLRNQPHGGRTIFEQLEFYSNVAYVLVLLTPEDFCDTNGEMKARARQNVIFELGYFLGRYTSRRVKGLVFGDQVLPSDIHGLLYVQVDDTNSWREELVRELQNTGLRVKYPS